MQNVQRSLSNNRIRKCPKVQEEKITVERILDDDGSGRE